MADRDCILLLQWALPRLRLRWPGFRRVRSQACKRVSERISCLGLSGAAAYRNYLEEHADEWEVLDDCCRITISRFYRDEAVFRALEQSVLPHLAQAVRSRGGQTLACWCAGCASGEEPFSLAILMIFLRCSWPRRSMRPPANSSCGRAFVTACVSSGTTCGKVRMTDTSISCSVETARSPNESLEVLGRGLHRISDRELVRHADRRAPLLFPPPGQILIGSADAAVVSGIQTRCEPAASELSGPDIARATPAYRQATVIPSRRRSPALSAKSTAS